MFSLRDLCPIFLTQYTVPVCPAPAGQTVPSLPTQELR